MDYRIQQLRYQLREDPASRYFFQLGELLRKQGELDEAAEILESGLEIHPRYVAAWVALGRTRQSSGNLVGAEDAYARALELDPEHGVAARLIGETAVARGDEVRAVTAFKLARALLGPDADLEERIADLETRTLGDAEPENATSSAVEIDEASVVEPEVGDDVFAVEVDPAEAEDPFEITGEADPWRRRPGLNDVVALGDDDPFAVTPTGQTGVFVLGDDVFTVDDPEPAPQGGEPEVIDYRADEVEPAREPVDDIWAPPAVPDASPEVHQFEAPEPPVVEQADPLIEGEPAVIEDAPIEVASPDVAETPDEAPMAVDEVQEVPIEDEPVRFDAPPGREISEVPGTEDLDDSQPPNDIVTEPGGDTVDGFPVVETDYPSLDVEMPPEAELAIAEEPAGEMFPVPTLTLARLAWEQDDLPLAEKTLEALLEENPDDADAADFLELVRNRPRIPDASVAEPLVMAEPNPESRVEALQGWLQRFRLAAERSRP